MRDHRPLRVAWVAVAVLLGVLAMHALSTHGMSGSASAATPDGPVAALAQVDVPADATHTTHAETSGEQQHGTMELCVALLVALGLAALLHMVSRDRSGHLARRDSRSRLIRVIRAHRPPALTLTQLCILRC